MRKGTRLLSIMLASAFFPVTAVPTTVPYLSIAAGPGLTVESGYDAAMSAQVSARFGVSMGDTWGAMMQGGVAYQSASAYTADWYRYRGFFGLDIAVGPRMSVGAAGVTAYALIGGRLARYDYSYSYFFFPYIEPGVSFRVASFGGRLGLDVGVSAPVYLRADSFGAGLCATATIALKPKNDAEPAMADVP